MARGKCEQLTRHTQRSPERETLPTAADLEANRPLLSKTSTLHEVAEVQSHSQHKVNEIQGRRRWPWSSWTFQLSGWVVSDAILGLSDGLTVPFALTAGLTALGDTRVVILGGIAELIAGAISMGLGGYVGAKSEVESFNATARSCSQLMLHEPETARDLVREYFEQFGLSAKDTTRVVDHIRASAPMFKEFLMQNHFQAAKPETNRPYLSALTLALSYFVGGFIPLIPYFVVARDDVLAGLWWSIGLMALVLLIFGYVKTGVVRGWTGRDNYRACTAGAGQMLIVGIIAAGAAVCLVRFINAE
ncbi:hypothetical protein A1O7_06042 [Cladophialophora yegresii CBS 114405]|uniref:Uncharacterized protein n=1 Tax=Cladophialophora yegresii CBS 114405 TaxID=1182544 RepID=W9W0W6_9EURO|nr:uncharacterized protein A1O7_06042 [Cladophialophora yegresii CBS 114405]EXJ58615.1 hypothetical protein A1O7_06042 [Cladophialophora yegresii CBS 114405]